MKNCISIVALLCIFVTLANTESILCPKLMILLNGEHKEVGGDIKCRGADEQCSYGSLYDRCRHCHVCARGPGEDCGGYYGLAGTCGTELTCSVPVNYKHDDEKLFGQCAPAE